MDFNKRWKLNYVFPKYRNPVSSKCSPRVPRYRNPVSSKCSPRAHRAVILGGTAIAHLSRKTAQLRHMVHTGAPGRQQWKDNQHGVGVTQLRTDSCPWTGNAFKRRLFVTVCFVSDLTQSEFPPGFIVVIFQRMLSQINKCTVMYDHLETCCSIGTFSS